MSYCKSNKLGPPRFQSLKSIAFKKHSSIGNLVSSPKLKRKSVLSLYLSEVMMEIQMITIISFPFLSHFPISFTFSFSQLTALFPILIHPHRNSLFSDSTGFTLYPPSLTALFCESSFTDSFPSFFHVSSRDEGEQGGVNRSCNYQIAAWGVMYIFPCNIFFLLAYGIKNF